LRKGSAVAQVQTREDGTRFVVAASGDEVAVGDHVEFVKNNKVSSGEVLDFDGTDAVVKDHFSGRRVRYFRVRKNFGPSYQVPAKPSAKTTTGSVGNGSASGAGAPGTAAPTATQPLPKFPTKVLLVAVDDQGNEWHDMWAIDRVFNTGRLLYTYHLAEPGKAKGMWFDENQLRLAGDAPSEDPSEEDAPSEDAPPENPSSEDDPLPEDGEPVPAGAGIDIAFEPEGGSGIAFEPETGEPDSDEAASDESASDDTAPDEDAATDLDDEEDDDEDELGEDDENDSDDLGEEPDYTDDTSASAPDSSPLTDPVQPFDPSASPSAAAPDDTAAPFKQAQRAAQTRGKKNGK
jgi:hypothetical protein